MRQLGVASTGVFTNKHDGEPTDFLFAIASDGTCESRVVYLGRGSETMEAELKLARQNRLE